MKLNGKNSEADMAGAKSVSAAVVSIAAMAIVLCCDTNAGQEGGGLARVEARKAVHGPDAVPSSGDCAERGCNVCKIPERLYGYRQV